MNILDFPPFYLCYFYIVRCVSLDSELSYIYDFCRHSAKFRKYENKGRISKLFGEM